MFRKSTNNPWVSPDGFINSGPFLTIGGEDSAPVLQLPGAGRFPGLLGATMVCSSSDALQVSKTSVGTLYEGVYQLVKFAASTTALQRGELLFWNTLALNGVNNLEVSNVVAATSGFRAGVSLFDAPLETADGKYGWIQVAGLASMRFIDAVTSNVLGNVVVQSSLTSAEVDAIADATDFFTTMGAYKLPVGLAYELPVDQAGGAVTRVLMSLGAFYPVIGRG